MPTASFGIVSMGRSLGDPHDVADLAGGRGANPELVRRMGFRRYLKVPPGVTTTDLAVRAARSALDEAGLSASQIDYLVVASTTVAEYLHWDLSASVARGLGMRGTPSLLSTQGCGCVVVAFEQIAGIFAVRPDVHNVLLVGAEKVSEQHTSRVAGNADSDGAAAAVLRRGHGSLRWMATDQVADSEYADFFRLEYGGSAVPVAPDGTSNLDVDPAYQVYRYFEDDPEGLADFAQTSDARLTDAIDGACARAGVKRADLSRLVLLNDNQPAMKAVAEAVGIPVDRTNAALAAILGHFGGVDPLICLDIYRDRGALAPGDLVAMAGMSSGMRWFCTLIEV